MSLFIVSDMYSEQIERKSMKGDQKSDRLLKIYMKWPFAVIIILSLSAFSVYFLNKTAGIVMSFISVISSALLLGIYFYSKKSIDKALAGFVMESGEIQKHLADDLDIPYALIDKRGDFAWKNKAFQKLISGDRAARKNINSVFSEIHPEIIDKITATADFHSVYNERNYHILLKNIAYKSHSLYAVYLYDRTEYLALQEEIAEHGLVVGLIYIDNYEELIERMEEVRVPLLMALVDRKLNQFICGFNGVIKKIEKDKYIFIIKKMYIDQLQSNKFEILEEIKSVNIGNKINATLSIGVGIEGETFAQTHDFARNAIDMALGRGGDQAVIKQKDIIQYFGGKSQSVERNTRVKARVKAHAMRELIESKKKVLIMGHKNMDIDCFGAAIGVWRIASTLNKESHIIIHDVNPSINPIKVRFDEPPYPDDIFISPDEAKNLIDEDTMLIVVDVNRPSITEVPEILEMVRTIVVLDHHRQSSEIISNADLSYVEPYASSTCEMVSEIIQYTAEGVKISPLEAETIYAGIVIDTQNFNNQTGVKTFEAAAYLKRNGADIINVRKLFREKIVDYRAKAEAVHNAEIFQKYFAISVCPAGEVESPTLICAQAANELLNIIGIKASIVLTEYDGTVYISARSIDEINVQFIMEKLGGGGHKSIAGAQLKGYTAEKAVKQIKSTITQMINEGELSL